MMRRRAGSRRLWPWLLPAVLALQCAPAAAQDLGRYDFTLGVDYRQADLDWNIAGDITGNNPNVLSELRWFDLELAQVNAAMHAETANVVVEAAGAYGSITEGKNQDSDYRADNRLQEFSRSNNDGEGHVADASVAVGYRFRIYDPSVRHYGYIIPMLGYSQHRQDMRIRKGLQTVPATGPIAGLDSRYDARWQGPWLSVRLELEANPRTALILDAAYHWADYTAEADWNLRDDLAHPLSFRHDTQGHGVVIDLALSHRLSRHWFILGHLQSQHWTADPGIDTLYSIDTGTGRIENLATRLNAVHWKSRTAGVAVSYRF